jgi:hypothetical protein
MCVRIEDFLAPMATACAIVFSHCSSQTRLICGLAAAPSAFEFLGHPAWFRP